MFDLPLHPISVHFPIVLGSFLPLVAGVLWWAIRNEKLSAASWKLIPAIALVYGLSAVVAVQLGGIDEEKVEKVVSEHLIEEHDEIAESVPWVAGGLLLVSLAGLGRKYAGQARLALVVLSLAGLIPLTLAGHSGGALVYQHGAGFAHLAPETQATIKAGKLVRSGEEEDKPSAHDGEDDD